MKIAAAAAPERPLRILHIITRLIVGGAQETMLLNCALVDRDRFPSEILSGVQTGVEGQLHDECRARGIPLHFEPSLVRELHPIKDPVALARLTRFIQRGGWDIVHTHSSKAGILGRMAARLAGAPVVLHTAHGWAFDREQPAPVRGLYVALERFAATLSRALVAVSVPGRETALGLGIGRRPQYHIIREGVEIEPYRDVAIGRDEARARLGLSDGALVVGNVGRLSSPKCPLDMIAAFAPLARLRPDARLVLVGDGPDRAAVESAIARLGLGDRVLLTGLRRDVAEIQRAFDLYLFASRWEGLPRVIVQAMAAGLPIIATRVGGVSDAVVDADNGFLVDAGDAEAMGRRLIELANDPALARRMGERGRERADEFSARRMARDLEALYTRLAIERGLIVR